MKINTNSPGNVLLAIGLCLLAFFVFRGCTGLAGIGSHLSTPSGSSASTDKPKVDEQALARKKVVVKSDIKLERDGDYLYIKGSVINKSSRTVEYWKVTVNFLKKGKIIDSNFANALETLLPGASKRFEIMQEWLPGMDDLRCYVEEVRFRD